MTTFEASKDLDLSPVSRPANAEPWKRKDPKQVLGVSLAAILPALITFLVGATISADPTIAVVAIFLPLQLVAAGIMGVRIFGRRGIAESLLIVFTILLTILVGSLLLSVLTRYSKGNRAFAILLAVASIAFGLYVWVNITEGGILSALFGASSLAIAVWPQAKPRD